MLSPAWLRQAVLRDSFSIAEQARALFAALRRAIAAGVTLAVIELALVFNRGAGMMTALTIVIGVLLLVALAAITLIGELTVTTLRESAFRPLDDLSAVARRLAGGDLEAAAEPHGAVELQQIASTMGILSHAIVSERNERVADRRAGEKENSSLREILSITRDVGTHLEPGPILAQLAKGAKRLGGYAEVIVWRFDELDSDLVPVYPPDRLGSKPNALVRVKVARSASGRAATSGQTVRLRAEDDRPAGLAVPLVVGGVGLRVLGVIELRGENTAEAIVSDPIDALEALASHAATALAAAQLYEQLEQRSETDALTKVFNRRKLETDLRVEIARSLRYGHPMSLIMVDVDHFKSINDTFGHQTGDEVLKVVAGTIGHGRETDAAYRFGGEEFAVLLRETDVTSARAVAERMRIKIKENVATMGLPRDVTASLGVASISTDVQTAEKLVEAADTALYEAKETGRNRVVVSKLARPAPGPAEAPAEGPAEGAAG